MKMQTIQLLAQFTSFLCNIKFENQKEQIIWESHRCKAEQHINGIPLPNF